MTIPVTDLPYAQQRILVRAARRDDHQVSSFKADALMDLHTAGLVSRGALTPAGLDAARQLMAADPSLR